MAEHVAAAAKTCSACGASKGRDAYSNKQWRARSVRRCLGCVASGATAEVVGVEHLAEAVGSASLDGPRDGSRQAKLLRRRCDVCRVQGPLTEPSFPVCDGCGVRRYCPGRSALLLSEMTDLTHRWTRLSSERLVDCGRGF